VTGPFDEMDLLHVGAGDLLHALQGAGRLEVAQSLLPEMKVEGWSMVRPAKASYSRPISPVGAYAIPVHAALEAGARELVAVDLEVGLGEPGVGRDLGRVTAFPWRPSRAMPSARSMM